MNGAAHEALGRYEDREHSLVKHTILASYLERCLMIIGQRWEKVAYIDCFAGPWRSSVPDLSDTSPGIAIKIMAECQAKLRGAPFNKQVRLRSVFLETDAQRADILDDHVQRAPSNIIKPEVWRTSFNEATPLLLSWLEPREFAFVFVDPFGWKNIVEPAVLAPFLRRQHTELLINFMWNFINLATGLTAQDHNMSAVFGKGWQDDLASGGEAKQRELMRRYRQQLTQVCGRQGGQRLRTTMLPVEYIDKKKVIFYLVYATQNPTGLVVFCEEAEKTVREQKRLKLQHRIDQKSKMHGQGDFFNADAHEDERSGPSPELMKVWLRKIPQVGGTLKVDKIVMADLIEETDALISDLQTALRQLIEDGIVENTHAQRPRPVHAVRYSEGEVLRRLK